MPRMPWNLLISLVLGYGAVVFLVFLFQSRLIYFPSVGREVAVTPQAYGLAFEPVDIATTDGETLKAWWVPADGPRGTILFFHGNAGNMSHRLDYLLMFSRLRYSTLILDYRGYGQSSGTPSEQGTYRDAEAAWDYLRHSRSVRHDDLVIAGESLGGAVAAWLAAMVPPRVLVLFSTFTSVSDLGAEMYWFLPVRLINRIGYDNLASLERVRAPLFLAHSRDDDVIPFSHGRKLFEAAAGPKAFVEMRGGHNQGFIFTRPEWVAQLAAFLEQHVARK
jgi:uncharacterized protein